MPKCTVILYSMCHIRYTIIYGYLQYNYRPKSIDYRALFMLPFCISFAATLQISFGISFLVPKWGNAASGRAYLN